MFDNNAVVGTSGFALKETMFVFNWERLVFWSIVVRPSFSPLGWNWESDREKEGISSFSHCDEFFSPLPFFFFSLFDHWCVFKFASENSFVHQKIFLHPKSFASNTCVRYSSAPCLFIIIQSYKAYTNALIPESDRRKKEDFLCSDGISRVNF